MFVFSLLTTAIFAAVGSASDVVVLTSENFEKETQASTGGTTGDWLIKFYAPWCGHCKKMVPDWDQLATAAKGKFNVGNVDVTENRDLGSRFGIKGFPSIKFLKQGEVFDYKGPRKVDNFLEFVNGGYKDAPKAGIPQPTTMMEELREVVKDLTTGFRKDIKKGNYFSRQVMIVALPVLFFVVMVFSTCFLFPGEDEPVAKRESKKAD